jgi:DNA primase
MPSIDYDSVKRTYPLMAYLTAMGWVANHHEGDWWTGPCPLHGHPNNRSRSFHVHEQFNGWHCHVCKVGGSVLDLSMRLKRLSITDAALDVCQTLGLPVPYLSNRVRKPRPTRNGEEAP